jgi:hypothetical protein
VSDLVLKLALVCFLQCFLAVTCGAMNAPNMSAPTNAQDAHAAQEKPSAKPESTPTAPEKPAEKHSTPEDRQRLVTVAHKLEAAPLDPALAPEREWAVSWVVAAPDIHVRICPSLLGDLRRPRYKYKSEIGEQLLISSAAFLIEHPDQAENSRAQSVGGMEGVLKAYSAIIKAEPQATAKPLDVLLEKQREGKLADAVWDIVKGCQ